MAFPLISIRLQHEQDVVAARQRARQIAAHAGFDGQDQVRIATAVSEIARNAFMYAGGGKVEFLIEGTTVPQILVIRTSDEGPGIRDIQAVLQGRYQSRTGMGVGMQGARRLMDQFRVETAGSGTVVVMQKVFPSRAPLLTASGIDRIGRELAASGKQATWEEVQVQNRELVQTLEALRARQEELAELNRELEDTNRGVVALYAELDERAEQLKRADQLKSTFLSHMSHEFRTPLNSIMALSKILLGRMDGPLTPEQEKQVGFIHRAAQDLTDLVNDLLDLAKVEAGKIELHPAVWDIATLFGTLRGMMRPLLAQSPVQLIVEEPSGVPPLHTDEGKVAQILRNFISNAIKFTEQGEIRMSCTFDPDTERLRISVADTGIGIALDDQQRIFQQYVQVASERQRKVRGTGLGLPLSSQLARLLGGCIELRSSPGAGSTFLLDIPIKIGAAEATAQQDVPVSPAVNRRHVVVLTDRASEPYTRLLAETGWEPVIASSALEAERLLPEAQAAIVDTRTRDGFAWEFLVRYGSTESSRPPIVVVGTGADRVKAAALGVTTFLDEPVTAERLTATLNRATKEERLQAGRKLVLLIDDEPVARYLVRKNLSGLEVEIAEARSGDEGIRMARELRPDAIILDMAMPDMSGLDVVDALQSNAATREIPVMIHTSTTISGQERVRLRAIGATVAGKDPAGAASLRARLMDLVSSARSQRMAEGQIDRSAGNHPER